MSNEQSEYIQVVSFDELTDQDWYEIRQVAIRIFEKNECVGDQMKIAVMAFLEWLEMNQEKASLYDGDDKLIH